MPGGGSQRGREPGCDATHRELQARPSELCDRWGQRSAKLGVSGDAVRAGMRFWPSPGASGTAFDAIAETGGFEGNADKTKGENFQGSSIARVKITPNASLQLQSSTPWDRRVSAKFQCRNPRWAARPKALLRDAGFTSVRGSAPAPSSATSMRLGRLGGSRRTWMRRARRVCRRDLEEACGGLSVTA